MSSDIDTNVSDLEHTTVHILQHKHSVWRRDAHGEHLVCGLTSCQSWPQKPPVNVGDIPTMAHIQNFRIVQSLSVPCKTLSSEVYATRTQECLSARPVCQRIPDVDWMGANVRGSGASPRDSASRKGLSNTTQRCACCNPHYAQVLKSNE